MIIIQGNNFIDSFFGRITSSLRLLDLLRVAPFVDEEVLDVEWHFELFAQSKGYVDLAMVGTNRAVFDTKKKTEKSWLRGGR